VCLLSIQIATFIRPFSTIVVGTIKRLNLFATFIRQSPKAAGPRAPLLPAKRPLEAAADPPGKRPRPAAGAPAPPPPGGPLPFQPRPGPAMGAGSCRPAWVRVLHALRRLMHFRELPACLRFISFCALRKLATVQATHPRPPLLFPFGKRIHRVSISQTFVVCFFFLGRMGV